MVWLRTLSFALLSALACSQAVAETLLVEFTTQNCGPCRRMRPVVQRLAAENYAVQEVDASTQPHIADRYGVTQFPTFVVLIDGQEYARLVGGTTHSKLVEMIHRATAIAAQQPQSAPTSQISLVGTAAERANPFAQAQQPLPGRVTQLASGPAGGQAPVQLASTAGGNPFASASASPAAAQSLTPAVVGTSQLIASTVRLSIADAQGKSTGTGTIIDARRGKALILTCGHLFRESQGKGVVEISMFRAGPQGAEPIGVAQGQVIDYDLDRDLALLCFETNEQVAVTPVAPRGSSLLVEAPVTSVGCGHGANPTPWESRITAVNRYQGHPNVEAARAPEEGRSGGGLFNAHGQLIGVCYAADPQGNEGLYASLDSIYAKLDALKLSATLQSPPQPSTLAAAAPQQLVGTPPFEVRGQSPNIPSTSFVDATASSSPVAAALTQASSPPTADPAALAPAERAALEEIGRRATSSEVIVIIRPKDESKPSEVIKINTASPEFVRTLEATAGARAAAPRMATEPTGGLVR